MKLFFIPLFFGVLLVAEEAKLDDLLSQYREASELSHETKRDISGHLTVFTRSDLDKMQAYTLNDVLKTIKMHTLMATKFGMSTLVKTPYSEKTISTVKVFIDSYEVTSLTSGTGLTQFGKMGLNFIDHVEVYQASNAISFNGEPGSMVIKLYTKEPSRENVTALQASVDSRGGSRTQVIEANSFEGYTYLANLDVSNYDSKEYAIPNGSELSRDGKRGQFNFNLAKKDDFKVEVGSAIEKDNLFSGFGKSIDDGEFYTKNFYAQFTKYFEGNIKLILNTSYENVDLTNRDSSGLVLQDNSISNFLETQTASETYNAILEKRKNYNDHELLFGMQFKKRSFSVEKLKSDGADKSLFIGPRDLNIYMLYFEDAYNINSNNVLTFGAKLDHYDNHQTSTDTQNILRVGYLSTLSDTTSVKAFIQKGYFYPLFSETTFSPFYYTNANLESIKSLVGKIELEQQINAMTIKIGGASTKTKDGISFNPISKIYVTSPETMTFGQYYINATYRFDAENKVIAEYFRAYKQGTEYSPNNGALLQLYNSVGRFDIYNELIYRSSYDGVYNQKINTGLDYTAGAIYHYSKQLDLKLKGENLFDRASQIGINGLKIAPYDRRAILTLEYIF
ncbi:MAG: TonB-dependent receptor [Sulfurimonas sp.]|nr:TonB-dependent receptor [Sulfurimonas sp.]